METKLIMLSNPILVSNEKIKEGDFYFKYDRILQWVKATSVTYTHVHPSNYPKPIVAGIEGLPKLDLSLIADEIGWVDVEKLAITKFGDGDYAAEAKMGFKYGFKAAQSIKEKYSKEDMIEFAHFCRDYFTHLLTINEKFNLWLSNRKPKEYLVEVEIEVNQCDGCISGHHIIDGIHKAPYPSGSMVCKKHLYDRPKITNNTITVTKVL